VVSRLNGPVVIRFVSDDKPGFAVRGFLVYCIIFSRKIYQSNQSFYVLKGQCPEIFDPRGFHQTISPRALIDGLKPFRMWLRIRRDNRLQSSDSAGSVSVFSMSLLDQFLRFQ
jgi:hypothetical protein